MRLSQLINMKIAFTSLSAKKKLDHFIQFLRKKVSSIKVLNKEKTSKNNEWTHPSYEPTSHKWVKCKPKLRAFLKTSQFHDKYLLTKC